MILSKRDETGRAVGFAKWPDAQGHDDHGRGLQPGRSYAGRTHDVEHYSVRSRDASGAYHTTVTKIPGSQGFDHKMAGEKVEAARPGHTVTSTMRLAGVTNSDVGHSNVLDPTKHSYLP